MNPKLKYFIYYYFLYLSIFATSCQSDRKVVDNEPLPPKVIKQSTISIQEFIEKPIDWSFIKKNLESYQVNPDNPIKTYTREDTYFTTSNDSLKEVTIINNGRFLNNNIFIGMQKNTFEALFSDLENHAQNPYVSKGEDDIAIGCCTNEDPFWSFEFEDDILMQINYNM